MNRDVTNVIRHVMDEWIPPFIRNSRWFMYPFFYVAYRGRNIRDVMDFKRRVSSFTAEDYDRFYNTLDTIADSRATDLNSPSLEFILSNIDPSARTLIDVGSGNGFLLDRIHQVRPDIALTGFDIKDADANGRVYRYVKGNIERLPFPDKSFDVVTCSHTLEHLVKLDQCISELVRIARKQLFIVTPCQRYYYYTLDAHVNFFHRKEELTSRIPLANYRCEKLKGDWVYVAGVDQ